MIGTFAQSALILLREGLEALLVIAALGAYLDRSGARSRLAWLYAGAGAAVLASLITAWLLYLFNNGVHNDLIEAVTLVGAAALLFYVSGWLFLRQDPKAWQGFLRSKADAAMAQNTGLAVAALAFLAVFREGAETALFVHALAGAAGGYTTGLVSGLAAALLALIGLFFVINRIARRLPLRPVFVVTSAFLFLMGLKFVGAALQELQEQQMLAHTEFFGSAWLEAVGFNPTVEAVAAQLAIAVLALVTLVVLDWRARHLDGAQPAGAR